MKNVVLLIHGMWQEGVPAHYIEAADNVIQELLLELRLETKIIHGFGGTEGSAYNRTMFGQVNELVTAAAGSAVAKGFAPGQLDISVTVNALAHQWEASRNQDEMFFLIVNDDYAVEHNGTIEEFIFGCSRPPAASTVSTFRFQNDPRITDRVGLFKLMVAHEFGHLIGAPDEERGEALVSHLGMHCTNPCVMQQRDDLPDFERDVLPLLHGKHLFCDLCTRDIRAYMELLLTA